MFGSMACPFGACGQTTSAELYFPHFKNEDSNSTYFL